MSISGMISSRDFFSGMGVRIFIKSFLPQMDTDRTQIKKHPQISQTDAD
jgi:hypothetical protein